MKTAIFLCLGTLAGFFGWSQLQAEPLDERVLAASKTIKQAVQNRDFRSSADLADWQQVIQEAKSQLPGNHHAVEMLKDLRAELSESPEDFDQGTSKKIQTELSRIQESMTFQRISEAPLPVGFPEPTQLHYIEVKKLPGYRLAKTGMKGNQNGPFMTLFQHIKRNDIAMTAPVEMGHASAQPDARETSMAFLYRKPDMGSTGTDKGDSNVKVVDVPTMTVVSIGCRGNMKAEQVEQAAKRLRTWLEEHDQQYEIAGPLRTLGYNSPFIPGFQRYFEVQIPVEKK